MLKHWKEIRALKKLELQLRVDFLGKLYRLTELLADSAAKEGLFKGLSGSDPDGSVREPENETEKTH